MYRQLAWSATPIVVLQTTQMTARNSATVLLVDDTVRTSWLHFFSYKSKHVVHSVLGCEKYAFEDAFDAAFTLSHDTSKLLRRPLELTMLTDSLSLFKFLFNASTTTEKLLMIDIRASHEVYENFEIRQVGWVQSEDNLSYILTKQGKCRELEEALATRKPTTKVMKWIQRSPLSSLIDTSAKEKTPEGCFVLNRKKPECQQQL